jgi:hypothetical protein
MGKALLKGKPHIFEELAERAYGRVPQGLEISGLDGGPLEHRDLTPKIDERIRELQDELDEGLTDTGLEQRIKDLQERLANRRRH